MPYDVNWGRGPTHPTSAFLARQAKETKSANKFPPPFTPLPCPQPPPSKVKYIPFTQVVFFWITVVLKMSSQSRIMGFVLFIIELKSNYIILYGSLRSAVLAKVLLSLASKILIITTSKSFYFNQDQEYILSLKQMF